MWVLSNQIKSTIKSNQTQNQSIKIKTSEVKVTSCSHESTPFCSHESTPFCSHESTPALTRAPESTLIHQKDRKICEARIPPSALMPESTLIQQIGFTRTNCAWIALNLLLNILMCYLVIQISPRPNETRMNPYYGPNHIGDLPKDYDNVLEQRTLTARTFSNQPHT